MKLVYISFKNRAYIEMFENEGYKITEELSEADLVVFTGGADINPIMYNEKPHRQTHFSANRDLTDIDVFRRAQALRIPCVGICRGGQFLNVMNGGRLYQHVDNHVGDHLAFYSIDGKSVFVSSTHHQMMIPSSRGVERLWAYESDNKETMPFDYQYSCQEIKHKGITHDTEAVYYPDTKCYCFQPHPEFEGYGECREFFFKEIKELLGV